MKPDARVFLVAFVLLGIFLLLLLPKALLRHESEHRLIGVVYDSSGAAAPNIHISIFPAGEKGVTDKEGRYNLQLREDPMDSRAPVPCVIARDFKRNLAVAKDISTNLASLDLTLQPGLTVFGRIEGPTNQLISKATLHVDLMDRKTGGTQIDSDIALFSDRNGGFEITALPADISEDRIYYVEAKAAGYGSTMEKVSDENPGATRIEMAPIILKIADQKVGGRVVSAENKPVSGARVGLSGVGQNYLQATSDISGGFVFSQVCQGRITIFSPSKEVYGQIETEAGDTNVLVTLDQQFNKPVEVKHHTSLVGKPLPDLTTLGLPRELLPANKPLLLCLFNVEQRPSRHLLGLLNERCTVLRQKGVVVLGLQATVISAPAFKEWKDANPMNFPIGVVSETPVQWVTETAFLPQLILTDARGNVTAEGFTFDELESKLDHAPAL